MPNSILRERSLSCRLTNLHNPHSLEAANLARFGKGKNKPYTNRERSSRERSKKRKNDSDSERDDPTFFFCEKKGHRQRDCREYKRAKRRLAKAKEESDSDADSEEKNRKDQKKGEKRRSERRETANYAYGAIVEEKIEDPSI